MTHLTSLRVILERATGLNNRSKSKDETKKAAK